MSIKYKVVKQIFGFDQSKSPRYVAKSVTGEMLDFEKVCHQVCQICGIHRGIVYVVISGLLDVLVNNLGMGHSVKLGEFGILRPGIRAKAQTSEEEADSQTIYRRRVTFVPGKMLKNFLQNVSITRMVPQDVDYTDGSSGNGNSGGDDSGDGGFTPDPNA